MFRLLFRALPYVVLILTPFVILFAIAHQFVDVPESPTTMEISELLSAPKAALPEWVRTNEGILLWGDSTETYRIDPISEKFNDTPERRELEDVYVPLVSPELFELWAAADESTSAVIPAPRCILVHFSAEDIRRDFPDYLAFRVNNSDPRGMNLVINSNQFPISFTTTNKNVTSHFGMTQKVVDQFLEKGYSEVLLVEPGSSPLSKAESVGSAISMVIFAGLSVLWIRKRRRDAANRAMAENLIVEAAWEGVNAGIKKAIRDAIVAQSLENGEDKTR